MSLVQIDYERWHWTSPALHFVFFLFVGFTAASLALVTGEAARARGDARVLLLSLAFLTVSGFMAVHAAGTQHVLTHESLPGFTVAITVGLLVAAPFAWRRPTSTCVRGPDRRSCGPARGCAAASSWP